MRRLLAFAAIASLVAASPAFAYVGRSAVPAGKADIPQSEMDALTVRYSCAEKAFAGTNLQLTGTAKRTMELDYLNATQAQAVGNRAVFDQDTAGVSAIIGQMKFAC